VRINPALFSAEYEKPPYQGGRIEIYTKPGASAFHGSGFFNFNDAALNARDAFAPSRAPTSTRRYGFQFGDPIISQRAGFLLDSESRHSNESATINAIILDANLRPAPFAANVSTPKRLLIGSARADWQFNPSHTFMARYDFNGHRLSHQGVGGFNLPDRAFHSDVSSHSLRFSETAILSASMLNEARLGLVFQRTTQRPDRNSSASRPRSCASSPTSPRPWRPR